MFQTAIREHINYARVKLQIEIKPVGESFKSRWLCEFCGKRAQLDACFADVDDAKRRVTEAARLHAATHKK